MSKSIEINLEDSAQMYKFKYNGEWVEMSGSLLISYLDGIASKKIKEPHYSE